jgi:hypothetical protein
MAGVGRAKEVVPICYASNVPLFLSWMPGTNRRSRDRLEDRPSSDP